MCPQSHLIQLPNSRKSWRQSLASPGRGGRTPTCGCGGAVRSTAQHCAAARMAKLCDTAAELGDKSVTASHACRREGTRGDTKTLADVPSFVTSVVIFFCSVDGTAPRRSYTGPSSKPSCQLGWIGNLPGGCARCACVCACVWKEAQPLAAAPRPAPPGTRTKQQRGRKRWRS